MSFDDIKLTGDARQTIRDAVRKAGTRADDFLAGRRVNTLTKTELLEIADMLGIDVIAIAAGAGPSQPAPKPAAVPAATPAPMLSDYLPTSNGRPFEDEAPAAADVPAAPVVADIATEVETVRREIAGAMVEGDFQTVTTRLTALVTDARKPAEVKIVTKTVTDTVTVYVDAAKAPPGALIRPAAPVVVPAPSGTETWTKLFGISGALGRKRINVFAPHPTTPTVDAKYQWPENVTPAALLAFGRPNGNVWLYGPAGTGKTSFAEQLAARTGRPFFLIPCDDTTEAPELVGMTVPHQGGVRWQDGVLTAALRVPHAIVLIDEPTVARAGAMMVFQSVLASRVLSIKETGEIVRVAEGIRFICADNTNGTGGGASEGYEGTRRMNRATLDRFSAFLRVDYMQNDREAVALVDHTGCTPALARILVECASLSRKARVTHAIGLRRLIAWAEALTDGLDPRAAFEFCILNSCARDDREPTEQCCALGLDKRAVTAAIAGAVVPPTPAPSNSRAAADFA